MTDACKHPFGILACLVVAGFLSACGPQPKPSGEKGGGGGDGGVVSVAAEDAEMNAAIRKAKETTAVFLKVLGSPMPNQAEFHVKRSYPTGKGSGQEHIWISDVRFDGKLLHGRVSDVPEDIPNLKWLQAVSFPPSELTDWMFSEGGKVVGAFTTRVLRKRMSPEEAAEFDQQVQFK